MSDLTDKWIARTLTADDVRAWFDAQGVPYDSDGFVRCIMSMYYWRTKGWPPGGFVTALLRNDFVEAALKADSSNREILWLYALFMHNVLPDGWRNWVVSLWSGETTK